MSMQGLSAVFLFDAAKRTLYVQRHQEFELAHQLVKFVWNREYSDVWRVLKSDTWRDERAAFLSAVASTLRQTVATSIGAAYSCISVNTACELLGVSLDDLIAGAHFLSISTAVGPSVLGHSVIASHSLQIHADCQNRSNWHIDTQSGFVRIQQDSAKPVSTVDLAELERITDHMISLA